MLSLVVITRDEADRLAACLESVPLAGERLVVDSGSTDGTRAVAEACGARVVVREWLGHVAQKNDALGEAAGEWALSLDADERLDPVAAASLVRALREPGDAAGFALTRCNRWLGRELRHGRFGRERVVRVVRAGRGRWVGDDPHDRLQVDGPVRRLPGCILHEPYRSLDEHLQTIDRYTRVQARALADRGVRGSLYRVALRPPLRFIDAYLLRLGFLDGTPGLAVASLGAYHTALKWWRVREASR